MTGAAMGARDPGTRLRPGRGWKIKGQGNAADRLGFTPQTLRYRMNKLGIVRPES